MQSWLHWSVDAVPRQIALKAACLGLGSKRYYVVAAVAENVCITAKHIPDYVVRKYLHNLLHVVHIFVVSCFWHFILDLDGT